MAFFRLPKLRRANAPTESSSDHSVRSGNSGRRTKRRGPLSRPRRLQIDPLEARQLLSVGPADIADVSVAERLDLYDPAFPVSSNRTWYGADSQFTVAAKAVGSDNDGDFVVAWTRNDLVYDLNTPDPNDRLIDPVTGLPKSDLNIYARYLTDEVQRVFLPPEILVDNDPTLGRNGRFSLDWGGNEVQKLSITATYEPWGDSFYSSTNNQIFEYATQQRIVGAFTLGADVLNNGVIATTTILFNESDFGATDPALRPQAIIQSQLRGLGGVLADVTVEALSPQEYVINFGDASQGVNQPLIQVIDQSWSSGFYPAAEMSTVREPTVIPNIAVSSADPWQTAAQIEKGFVQTTQGYEIAPVDVQAPDHYNIPFPAYYFTPNSVRAAAPKVSVVPVSLPGFQNGTVFDVTFTGNWAKTNVPEMTIVAATDDLGNDLMGLPQLGVKTLKEPSPEFQVNPAEPVDPLTGEPNPYNQRNPSVAMDADGDFVIAWESDVADSTSVTDIFARRFSPQGLVNVADAWQDVPGHVVQGVRPLGGQFPVNSTKTNSQITPAAGMDFDGNVVIAWANIGQDLSYFNTVSFQRFNRDGERVGNESQATTSTPPDMTAAYLNPAVAMSRDGHFAIAWEITTDPGFFNGTGYFTSISAVIYDQTGTPGNPLPVLGSAGDPSVAFDPANNLVLAWNIQVADSINSNSGDSQAQMFDVNGNIIRQPFRINSGTGSGVGMANWSLSQLSPQVAVDADGDLVASYDGFGVDMSEWVQVPGSMFAPYINDTTNADLKAFFNPQTDSLYPYSYNPFYDSSTDVDGPIEIVLINAVKNGATPDQVGRLRAILDKVAGLLRGDANGVMFTRWDSDPTLQADTVLTSDNQANSQRDGHNTRIMLAFDQGATTGNLTVRLYRWDPELTFVNTRFEQFDIAPVYTNNFFDPGRTLLSIRNTMNGLRLTGDNWPANYGPQVEVRLLGTTEITQRQGTAWDLSAGGFPSSIGNLAYVYELDFGGESHDSSFDMYIWDNRVQRPNSVPAYVQIVKETAGFEGTEQFNASIGMEPDGSFVLAWTQQETYTDGFPANTSIKYRRFEESTDTAGPLVSDTLLPSGERLQRNAQLTQSLGQLVVTFDEDMMRVDPKSLGREITNPNNWVLLDNGQAVQGGVVSVQFGLNMAADLGLASAGSNKWEAVLTFDGNGPAAGAPQLGTGRHQIIAKNTLADRAGNALGRSGYVPNGAPITWTFDITIPSSSSEELVNASYTVLDQETYAHSQQTVASDPNGDYVVVYTSDEPGQEGVWAQVYYATWAVQGTQRVSPAQMTAQAPVRVTSEPTAESPSVAMDTDGDFIITWSQQDWDESAGAKTDWNIYARRFRKDSSRPLDPVAWRVNVEESQAQNQAQRFSAVAVDAEGDFVITWQSFGQDTPNSYGVYAQRYNPAGTPMGGQNEIQQLTFVNRPFGTFVLNTSRGATATIEVSGSAFTAVRNVQDALEALGFEVNVTGIDANHVTIEFLGKDGSQNVALVGVASPAFKDVSSRIIPATLLDGTLGEFQVNETAVGNQMYPAIAMAAQGDFVITWTSEAQDGDAPWETNIYARKFVSNQALPGSQRVLQFGVVNPNASYKPLMTTVDSPANHVVAPGTPGNPSPYGGVVTIVDSLGLGSGSLLSTASRRYILTAAHVVADTNAVPAPLASITVTFDTPTGPVNIGASALYVHPLFNGLPWTGGHDIAVIELASPAPAGVPAYTVYRDSSEIGQVFAKVGYGLYGTGTTGYLQTNFDGQKRLGQNTYDTINDIYGDYPDGLAYDFDNGSPENDALGVLFNINHLGIGTNEISGAPGDSGGPNFINGEIAGVTSYGIAYLGTHDVLPGLQGSFGDMGVDARVSLYAGWIDAITLSPTPEFRVNDTVANDQKWSSIAMDSQGDFVITWTAYGQDGVGGGPGPGVGGLNGVFAKRYDSSAQPVPDPGQTLGREFQVNTFAEGSQQYSHVATDANGDFVIAWESFQDKVSADGSTSTMPNSYGVYAQRYLARVAAGGTPRGTVGGEIRINTTLAGDQRYPGAAMDHTGDFVVVWSGQGQADSQGVFSRRFEVSADVAGPIVADVLESLGDDKYQLIREGAVLDDTVSQFVLEFSEDLSTLGDAGGANSVTNINNWTLTKDGSPLLGSIIEVQYVSSAANPGGKNRATVTFDGDPAKSGIQPLDVGQYTLTVSDTVQDRFKNALDGNYDGVPGAAFNRNFSILIAGIGGGDGPGPGTPDPNDPTQKDNPVNANPTGNQTDPAVATDAEGNYVVVWVSVVPGSTGTSTDGDAAGDIVAQRFDPNGNKIGSQFVVNTFRAGAQSQPDVAMGPFGDFVVVWANQVTTGTSGLPDSRGIYSRRFDSEAKPLNQSDQLVNDHTFGVQEIPAVATDPDGNFVITWSGEGRHKNLTSEPIESRGVWAKKYDSAGIPVNGGKQVLVNTYKANTQEAADVAMDANGRYFVVWRSERQDAGAWGVYGQRFAADGTRIEGEQHLNKDSYGATVDPRVAMDANGNTIVVWAGNRGDGYSQHVFARRLKPDNSPADGGREFYIDSGVSAGFLKQDAAVSMSDKGEYAVTWSSFAQDQADELAPRDEGVYARMFRADGKPKPYTDPRSGETGITAEFRINATTLGDQNDPAVAMDPDGDFVAVWVGPDIDPFAFSSTGIWSRLVRFYEAAGKALTRSEGWSGGWSDGTQFGNLSMRDTLLGSAASDQIAVTAGATPGAWLITINGNQQNFNSLASGLVIDGRGGSNTLNFVGIGTETYDVYPDRVVITDVTGAFELTVSNITTANIDGAGGSRAAAFHDSLDAEVFTFRADTRTATLSNAAGDFAMNVTNLAQVQASSSGGSDTATLYDSADRDVFTANATSATLSPASGGAYSVKVSGFRTVQAYSTAGGSDLAKLQGSPGTPADILIADPNYTSLSDNASYLNQANGFKEVQVFGSGGADRATFYDSDASMADTFTVDAKTGEATMLWGTRASTKSYFINNLEAIARPGNSDTARLSDSLQADAFVADSQGGTLSGIGYSYKATGFRSLIATATTTDGKTDTATLNDSKAADVFIGTATYGMLVGPTYTLRANSFDTTAAWSKNGGADNAKLYDSTKADTFTVRPSYASLLGNEARNFARVQAFSTLGGADTAKFTDTTEKDWFVAGPNYAYLYNQSKTYYARANGFRNVEATSSGQGDQANLADSALNDTFNGYANRAELLFGTAASLGSVKVNGFPNVTASATAGGVDVANLASSAGNDSFAGSFNGATATGTFSGLDSANKYFSVRADKFEQVVANAGSSGTHSARLTDSALVDLLHLQGSQARLTDLNAAIGLWANSFGNVNTKLSSKADKVEIVPPVNFTYTIDQPK